MSGADEQRAIEADEGPAPPAWQRTLLELDKVLDETPASRTGIVLSWRLIVTDGYGVEVSPWVQKLGKKGQPGAAKRLGKRHLLIEHGAKLSPEDARLAELLPYGEEYAGRALLEALVGHPRVCLESDPARPVRVERTVVGLVAEHRGGFVRVSAGVDGTVLPPALLQNVKKLRAAEALFLWDGGLLTLLDVKPDLKAALAVFDRGEALFPPEAQPALLGALAKWAQRLPVVMPRSVMGESVPVEIHRVLHLAVQPDGSVEIALRLRALADGPSHAPGEGARDVHVRRGAQAFHAVRDLAAESRLAAAWSRELGLVADDDEERPFHYTLPSPEAALALMGTLSASAAPPDLEWIGVPLRSVGTRGPPALRVALEKRHEWFGALGGLTVGGEHVQLARLLDAARRRERFVRISGSSYVELTEALRAQLELLADHARDTRAGLFLGPSSAGVLRELEREGAVLAPDPPFRELQARIGASEALVPEIPAALAGVLRPYQEEGFRWLCRLAARGAGGVLADDMGLGKTVQVLAFLLARRDDGPALVVAPASVAFNWREEAARFAPSLRLVVYAEAASRAEAIESLGPGDVLVMSYGLLVRDVERLAGTQLSTLVLDEAQVVKNAGTRRHQAVRTLRAGFTVALSGTPIENHLGELWSLFFLVYPALLGGWASFRRRFASPIERRTDPSAAPALARLLAPFLLRRTKSAVAKELPPRIEAQVPVLLSSAEWALYEDARLAALTDLGAKKTRSTPGERRLHVLAALTRLRLLACHPRLGDPHSVLPSSKLARLLSLVTELIAEGQRALIFSQLTSHLAVVREALDARDIRYVYLDGQTPQNERGGLVNAFQEGHAPLFLISTKAGGFGLNLTAASNVVHLDPWWNPAVEDQASDRAHRLGQALPVTIYRLVSMGTIEEKMLAMHEQKRDLVAQVLAGTDRGSSLSTDELEALLGAG